MITLRLCFLTEKPVLIGRRCRNIYYKDPELFKSQTVVDRYVDILAYTFGIHRAALNVVSPPVSRLQRVLLLYLPNHQDGHSKRSDCWDFRHHVL